VLLDCCFHGFITSKPRWSSSSCRIVQLIVNCSRWRAWLQHFRRAFGFE
jgi:hypothetical protein